MSVIYIMLSFAVGAVIAYTAYESGKVDGEIKGWIEGFEEAKSIYRRLYRGDNNERWQ